MSARRSSLVAAMAALTLASAAPLAGCGGDDTTAPQSTFTIERAPTTTSSTTTTSTEATSTSEGTGGVEPGDDNGGQDDSGSSGSGSSGSGGAAVPDTPSNDVTPPSNTPQGQFEQFCNQNPGACG